MNSNQRPDFSRILDDARTLLTRNLPRDAALLEICTLLAREVPYYNWVGFYLTVPGTRTLRLGPYVGAPTDHVEIPFGRGICGQAAATGKNFVVQDVSKEANYLSCSIHVKSEIVLPIVKDGVVVGELDIDSHTASPFTDEDERCLGEICEMVSRVL